MDPKANGNGWALKVVRGREPGRVFALGLAEVVLGNAPGEGGGIDLAGQEAENALRKMASRHASVDCSNGAPSLRDLESPGGTFVNRQRVLSGQARPLGLGDVIQLGGVQLEVVEAKKPAAPATSRASKPEELFLYQIPDGPTCRSWDEILTVSAQRWDDLRDDLVSGRLADFVASIGRADLTPSPLAVGSPDERLDAWLGTLPTAREARPELEVGPPRLKLPVVPGGGTRRHVLHVSNVGHRLLRSTARVEPSATAWLSIAPEFSDRPFFTVEETEFPFLIAIPETIPAPLTAEIVFESNGGTRRVEVTIEAKSARIDPIGPDSEPARPSGGVSLVDLIARQSTTARLISWGLIALAARLLVGFAGGSIGEGGMAASGLDSPGLGRVALALAAVGAVLGGLFASRRGGPEEAPSGAFAGACAGVIASTALVAACRAVEPALGGWSTSVVAVSLVWALIGSGLAALSTFLVKGRAT